MTSQNTSQRWMASIQTAPISSRVRLRLIVRGMRKKNGTAKWPMASSMVAGRQLAGLRSVPSSRLRNQFVSSGMFAYQMRKNWLKAM